LLIAIAMSNTIALDTMGGDFGPQVVVPAALSALNKHEDLQLILVGDQAEIEQELDPLQTLTVNDSKFIIRHKLLR